MIRFAIVLLRLDNSVIEGQGFLMYNILNTLENGAIPVDDEFLKLLQKAEYIYIGVSPHDAFKVEIVGHVAIDKITVGKLIAFFEMQKQNMMSETVSES
jgi:hypothetical protein